MNVLGKALGMFCLLILLSAIFAYPAMLLWNGCLVPATDLKEVTWLQMWGIQVLVSVLFKTNTNTK
jgi:hypothetical protein